jgi:hypothetical protein
VQTYPATKASSKYMEFIDLPVNQIGWSQDSISGTFQMGGNVQAAVNALRTLNHDQRRDFIADTYPPIRVVCFDQQGWITLDNRRLYIFRQVLDRGTTIRVQVATAAEAEELRRKLTTTDEGATIVIRR